MKIRFLDKRGFSLVEMVVVLAILGVLLAIVIASTSAAREKARDEKRLGDLREIQIGLALYHDVNRTYPPSVLNNINDLDILVTQKYLPSIPTDPTAGNVYEYMVTGSKYCLGAKLERAAPNDSIACQSAPVGTSVATYKVQR